jgi:hypothetical protein
MDDSQVWPFFCGPVLLAAALGRDGMPSSDTGDEWICVDLGGVYRIDRINLLWGWKIHPGDFAIDVAVTDPNVPGSWTEVVARELVN